MLGRVGAFLRHFGKILQQNKFAHVVHQGGPPEPPAGRLVEAELVAQQITKEADTFAVAAGLTVAVESQRPDFEGMLEAIS